MKDKQRMVDEFLKLIKNDNKAMNDFIKNPGSFIKSKGYNIKEGMSIKVVREGESYQTNENELLLKLPGSMNENEIHELSDDEYLGVAGGTFTATAVFTAIQDFFALAFGALDKEPHDYVGDLEKYLS